MHLFGKKSKDSEERLRKLMFIKEAVKSEFKLENRDIERSQSIAELRKTYRIESLWVIDGEKTVKYGDLDYSNELDEFKKLKKRLTKTSSLRLQRGDSKCHIIEKNGKIIVFSTPLDLTNTDIFILLKEVNNIDMTKTQTFLEENSKYKDKESR